MTGYPVSPFVTGVLGSRDTLKIYGALDNDVISWVLAYPANPFFGDRYYNATSNKIGTYDSAGWYEVTPKPGQILNFLNGSPLGLCLVWSDGSINPINVIPDDLIVNGKLIANEVDTNIIDSRSTPTILVKKEMHVTTDGEGIRLDAVTPGAGAWISFGENGVLTPTSSVGVNTGDTWTRIENTDPATGIYFMAGGRNALDINGNGNILFSGTTPGGINITYMTNMTVKFTAPLGPGRRLINLYSTNDTDGDYRYAGNYINTNVFGFMTEALTRNYLFSSATGAATKYDSFRVRGAGGIDLFNANSVPSVPATGNTLYSSGGMLYNKDALNAITPVLPSYGEIYIRSSANTVIASAGRDYALTATSWVEGSQNLNFKSTGSAANLLLVYTGPSKTVNISANASIAASIVSSRLVVQIYQNPVIGGGGLLVGGTVLNAKCQVDNANANSSSTFVLKTFTYANTGDTFVISIQSAAICNATATQGVLTGQ